MHIRLFHPKVREEAIAAAADVMRSGWVGLGPKVAAFEQDFSTFLADSRNVPLALALNTGTSALHVGIKLLNLHPNDEVITSPATFVGANEVLLYEGLTPVFADIDLTCGNLTAATIAAAITPRTRAIMLVHFGGYACDLDSINSLAKQHNLPIVEDCAHACGASFRNQRIGNSGNLCAFSFDPIKNLTTGDGGMLTGLTESQFTRAKNLRYMGLSKDAFSRVHQLGHQPRAWEYEVPELGYRYHMNDIAAAMGIEHLKCLDADNARRNELTRHYFELLRDIPGIELPRFESDRQHSFHLFWILADNRDRLIEKLANAGIITGVHYTRNDAYALFQKANLPNAESFCSRVLSLPLHLDVTLDEIHYIAEQIRGGW